MTRQDLGLRRILRNPIGIAVIGILLTMVFYTSLGAIGLVLGEFLIAGWYFVLYRKEMGSRGALVMAVSTLLLFDAPAYIVADIYRYWYLGLIMLVVVFGIRGLSRKDLQRFKHTVLLFVLPFLLLSIMYMVIEPMEVKLNIIKYWLFYVLLIVMLAAGYKEIYDRGKLETLTTFLVGLGLLVWGQGIVQVLSAIFNLPLSPRYLRPRAFFSETTWYAEFLVIIILVAFYAMRKYGRKFNLIYIFTMLTGILLSVTRNAFLALAVCLLLSILMGFASLRLSFALLKNGYFYIGIILLAGIIMLLWDQAVGLMVFSRLQSKFSASEDSAASRLEGFAWSLSHLSQSPIIGNGFYWGKDMITNKGTALGSKSFNIFFMFHFIFGLFGSIPLILGSAYFLIRNTHVFVRMRISEYRYAVLLMAAFLTISFFAPMHQYSIGMQIVALAFMFSHAGHCEKKAKLRLHGA